MTIIAYDGTHLYSDTQFSTEDSKSYGRKIFKVGGKSLAFAGDIAALDGILAAVEAGTGVTEAVGAESTIIIADGPYAVIHSDGKSWREKAPVFLGSGSPFARGAYHACSCVRSSVKAAMSLDLFSGGTLCKVRA